ncbi:ABC transporter ATP-binding protein/permease [Christensenellaceae bacterium OttesenSCG-928-L17]|nr:ABC transporter ATP-binding protein/permease [Christensenellaceae bacterium OttesenSCG-928-L17]
MKNKNTRVVLKRLSKYLHKYRAKLIVAAVLMLVSNLLLLFVPLLSGNAIDAIGLTKGGVNFPAVFRYCALMLLCYAASSVLSYLLSVGLIRMSQDVSFELRRDIFERFVQLPVSFYDRHPVGDIISCICYDVDTVNASLSTDLLQICVSVITVVGSLAMLIALSPALSLVVLVTVPVTMVFSRVHMRRLQGLFRARSKKLGELNSLTEESVSAQKTANVYGCEESMIARFEASNAEAIQAYYIADYKSCILGPGVNFINNISLSAGSALGVILCLSGQITLGAVSSFVLYSRKFSGPIREAANIMSEIQAAVAAAERVFRLMDEPIETPDVDDAMPLSDAHGNVGMEHVSFGYEAGKTVLQDLSIDIKRGSVVAIVGPTGAGKTTIVNLLMRFYDTNAGRITVDGQDIREVIRRDLRLSYAMVLQDTWLFRGSIYDNIAYGNRNATYEQVVEAAKAAKIHSFISSLPAGYDTMLDDDSVNISKGQKQLFTIARAMLIDARMLILDEATSNVDTQTEIEINEAMQRLMKDKTCFVIAHRLSTIERADLILVMDGGAVVEQGTHAELIAKKGLYQSIYASQFEIY